MAKYRKGNIVKAKVTYIEPYGAFVKLDEEYKGLIHISEISNGYVKNINKILKKGQIINGIVLDVDEEKKQVRISIKNAFRRNKRKIVRKSEGFYTLEKNLPKWIKRTKNEIKLTKK